MRMMPEVQIHA